MLMASGSCTDCFAHPLQAQARDADAERAAQAAALSDAHRALAQGTFPPDQGRANRQVDANAAVSERYDHSAKRAR